MEQTKLQLQLARIACERGRSVDRVVAECDIFHQNVDVYSLAPRYLNTQYDPIMVQAIAATRAKGGAQIVYSGDKVCNLAYKQVLVERIEQLAESLDVGGYQLIVEAIVIDGNTLQINLCLDYES